eukprot:1178707-Prorocentrum_minimum.AAC.9
MIVDIKHKGLLRNEITSLTHHYDCDYRVSRSPPGELEPSVRTSASSLPVTDGASLYAWWGEHSGATGGQAAASAKAASASKLSMDSLPAGSACWYAACNWFLRDEHEGGA